MNILLDTLFYHLRECFCFLFYVIYDAVNLTSQKLEGVGSLVMASQSLGLALPVTPRIILFHRNVSRVALISLNDIRRHFFIQIIGHRLFCRQGSSVNFLMKLKSLMLIKMNMEKKELMLPMM
jgi:hypothetical protein